MKWKGLISPDDNCRLCGHVCLARRSLGETGRCGAGREVGLSSALLHLGEEPPLSGGGEIPGGSGTIFFTRCVLGCVFCQNWQISQRPTGRDISEAELAEVMLRLEAEGAFNINLVSPTPYTVQIALALGLARKQGLSLPVVHNSGGYDSISALRVFDGLVDIYLPDAKMAPPAGVGLDEPDARAACLLGAGDYPKVNREALLEMLRQVGHLQLDGRGLARRGLLIRHLVLPDDLARTKTLLPWLAETFGPAVHLSLMAQYHPCHQVQANPEQFRSFPGLTRRLSLREYEEAVDLAVKCGLMNAYVQDLAAAGHYLPDFDRPKVFIN
ncbi:MAG: radical SAM protein [Deltaproteobacteria bacterium]|nr:radical SAM protein [Deltaproteobacteria bacterium]